MAVAARHSSSTWTRCRELLGLHRDDESARAEHLDALRQLGGALGEGVHRLPAEDQLLVALRFGRSMTVAQVARLTRRSRDAVQMQQLLVLRVLQQELESGAPDSHG